MVFLMDITYHIEITDIDKNIVPSDKPLELILNNIGTRDGK